MIELFKIGFLSVTLIDLVDLILVSWIFYKVYQYFRGTRAGQMLVGLIILLIISFLFNAFGLSASSWLVNQFQTVWVVAFVILFQPELRRLLIYVGQTRFFQKIFRVGSSRTKRKYQRRFWFPSLIRPRLCMTAPWSFKMTSSKPPHAFCRLLKVPWSILKWEPATGPRWD